MSSHVIQYKGRGFGAKEWGTEIWLAAIGQEIVRQTVAPEWMQEMGSYWREEAVYGHGCIIPALEEQLEDQQDIRPLIAVAESVAERLEAIEAAGERYVSLETFDLHSPIPHLDTRCSTRYVINVARAIVDLLRETLPPDKFPYPFVRIEGLIRSPQGEREEVAHGDRLAFMLIQLPVRDVEEAREIVARLLEITFTKPDSKSRPRISYLSTRGKEKFALEVNREVENSRPYQRHPADAIFLVIDTKVSHCREYERKLRLQFGPQIGRIRKHYV
jgi:hypothetical protein